MAAVFRIRLQITSGARRESQAGNPGNPGRQEIRAEVGDTHGEVVTR
jgi:hypothetical protein